MCLYVCEREERVFVLIAFTLSVSVAVSTFCNETEALSAFSSKPQSFHLAIVEVMSFNLNNAFSISINIICIRKTYMLKCSFRRDEQNDLLFHRRAFFELSVSFNSTLQQKHRISRWTLMKCLTTRFLG